MGGSGGKTATYTEAKATMVGEVSGIAAKATDSRRGSGGITVRITKSK
jgi:hypothetical protein